MNTSIDHNVTSFFKNATVTTYSFIEYIAALEGETFDVLEPKWLNWAVDLIAPLNRQAELGNFLDEGMYTMYTEKLAEYQQYKYNFDNWKDCV